MALTRQAVHERVLIAENLRLLHQTRRHMRIEASLDFRQQIQTKPIAQQSRILIAPIHSKSEMLVLQVLQNLPLGYFEQRTDHRERIGAGDNLMQRRHAAHSFQAGAAQKPHQHSFRLIVQGMARGNFAELSHARHIREETISFGAAERLEIAPAGLGFHVR